jgi:transcriptional regulator with XRE-family HTH domain
MPSEIMDIAARMKELREICEFSQEEMAEKLNVTPRAYAAYESGEIDIPISVLLAMASACSVEPSALLTGGEPKLHVYCLTRAGEGVGIDRRKEYRYQSLAYNFGGKIAEPFIVTAGAVPAGTPLVVNCHDGQEFDYVIEGTLRLIINGTELLLNPGDSIYFNSGYPHGMQAVGNAPSKFLAVVL